MNTVEEKFELIGARARVAPRYALEARIDVGRDKRGEFFDLLVPPHQTLEVLDVRPKDRHLVLLVRGEEKHRFLCGHDERHWFVAAVPESTPVSTVAQAKGALKPPEVRAAEGRVRRKLRNRRRNPAWVRQGEWFFVPAPNVEIDPRHVYSESLTRGRGSKPHRAEELARFGGETVYVCHSHPEGLTPAQYERMIDRFPGRKSRGWQVMRRNPEVYVRGRVTHPDHSTIVLKGWHRVFMNTESRARARRNVAFLD